jgi:ribose transport system substrate-binding protein
MKKMLSILAMILVFACIFSLAACNGNAEPVTSPAASPSGGASSPSGEASAPAASPSDGAALPTEAYHIGMNVWGTAPVLTLYGDETEYAVKAVGMTNDRASDDNNADKELQNIQNFISQGVDGLCIQGAGATTIPQMGTEALNAKVPFVLCIFTGTPEVRAELTDTNPYYAGAAASDLQADGRILAEKALADGCKTACMIGGNIGDLNMDNRAKGFQDGFTAGGGTILAEERCTDNSEALSKASSMLSAHKDVDCIYIMVGDYVEGTLTALDTLGIEGVKCYLSAVNAGSADYIRSGQIQAGSGGTALCCNVAPTLLLNMLDGHPITDADGKARSSPSHVARHEGQRGRLCRGVPGRGRAPRAGRCNQKPLLSLQPDVTYETYVDTITNELTVDAILKRKRLLKSVCRVKSASQRLYPAFIISKSSLCQLCRR